MRYLGRIILAMAFGAAVGYSAHSKAQSVIIHGVSHHTVGEHNNNNFGVGYRTVDGAIFGAYHNSEGGGSVYAGYDWKFSDYGGVVFAGALGYKETPIMPLIMPYVSIPIYQHLRINVGVAPVASDGRTGVLIHSMIEYRF